MAAQYDVNLEKCALLKCLCGSAFAAHLLLSHTDKSSRIHLSNL